MSRVDISIDTEHTTPAQLQDFINTLMDMLPEDNDAQYILEWPAHHSKPVKMFSRRPKALKAPKPVFTASPVIRYDF